VNYTSFVNGNDFGVFALAARNAARLLDEPLFQVNEKSDTYNVVPARQALFDKFCSICIAATIEVPPLEQALIDAYLPRCKDYEKKGFEKQKEVAKEARARLTKVKKASDLPPVVLAVTMTYILDTFPGISEYSGVNGKQIMSVLNDCLLKLGLSPIRPEYQAFQIFEPLPRRFKIVIVDDEAHSILKTALAMIGWDLDVQWLYCQRSSCVASEGDKWTAQKSPMRLEKSLRTLC